MVRYACVFAFSLFFLLFQSCGGGGDDGTDPAPEEPVDPEITVPEGEENFLGDGINFESAAGEKTLVFRTNADWEILINEINHASTSWCSVTPRSGKAGLNTVKVKVAGNLSDEGRNLLLRFKMGPHYRFVTVSQRQKDIVELRPDVINVGAMGEKVRLEVNSNINYKVRIPEVCRDWIVHVSGSRSLKMTQEVFLITENTRSEGRDGEIILQKDDFSRTVKVHQDARKMFLLYERECHLTDRGGLIGIPIRKSDGFDVKMPVVDWIARYEAAGAVSEDSLYFRVKDNVTYKGREAEVVFFDRDSDVTDTLHITQTQRFAIVLSPSELYVPYKGGLYKVDVASNVDYTVEVGPEWIRQEVMRDLDGSSVVFSVEPNTGKEMRVGRVRFVNKENDRADTLVIKQNPEINVIEDQEGVIEAMPWS